MKAIAFLFLFPISIFVSGCTQQSALQKQLDLSEAKVRELSSEVSSVKEQHIICQKLVSALNNFHTELVDDYDKAATWIDSVKDEATKKASSK